MTLLALTSTGIEWSFIWMVTILGFILVLMLLFVFVYIMKLLGFVMRDRSKEAPKNVCTPASSPKAAKVTDADMAAVAMALHLNESDADMAAVAMALQLYNNAQLSTVPQITLQGHSTAWNNKVFGINNLNR